MKNKALSPDTTIPLSIVDIVKKGANSIGCKKEDLLILALCHSLSHILCQLNSSPINVLGNWCLAGWQGAWVLQAQQGGIHGNPASGNHPCMQPPSWHCHTEKVQWRNTYLTLYSWIMRVAGLGAIIHNNSQIVNYRKNLSAARDPPRSGRNAKWSTKISCNVTKNVCKPQGVLQSPTAVRVTLKVTHTNRGDHWLHWFEINFA